MSCRLQNGVLYFKRSRALLSTASKEAVPATWSIHQTVGHHEEEIKVNKDGNYYNTALFHS